MSGNQSNLNLFEAWPPELLDWKARPGAGLVMEAFYRWFGFYWKRFCEKRIGVSQRLIEELVRDEIRLGRLQGVKLDGYALNSHLTKPILLHVLHEHPEWKPMFEIRDKQEQENQIAA